ncbi:hypothetical protein XNC3_180020 [Xenorhabdus nematophila F1]|nr:hypothetical protein XNC3_180020 [Xenorhabdus nematophila F1]CEE95045.1 hypothetical protein XNA1_490023 [Xenorhabdus nematophila str. Anatoliense]CEE95367.1 hypothetical protein XNA1_5100023 [Xenorhabdus nematophila str. Anatoliense]CEF31687.1 hypothetical protein XNW1_390023 [Xenorhabdus nematophila str. Websteri]CEF32919.1 hypothetical protein XNW1_4560023 [Xenorhabdus nematophila str. Websteri]
MLSLTSKGVFYNQRNHLIIVNIYEKNYSSLWPHERCFFYR